MKELCPSAAITGTERTKTLARAVARMNGGEAGDDVVRGLTLSLDGHAPVVPAAYLEPLRSSQRLHRGDAALLLDTAARACADARGLGTRLAVLSAHRLRSRRAFQRLGYRSDADYAREELALTPRAFRDLARLGARLEKLPSIRAAFLDGAITRTQAEVIAAVATPANEAEWLTRAANGTVRQLKAAARGARAAAQQEREPDADDAGIPDRRLPRTFDVPRAMLGKIDSVLAFGARVAGADLPPGALWELIAAEYLSGAPPSAAFEAEPATEDSASDTERASVSPPPPKGPPEDPRGYQAWLEQESHGWHWLPRARPQLEARGDWLDLGRRLAGESPRSPWELHRDLTAALAAERRVGWQLARLLRTIRNRRLWRDMLFSSFAHYVRERLGIPVRSVERLIRVDREAWRYPPLRRAWEGGELSPIVAEALLRVLRWLPDDAAAQRAWIDFAANHTFAHLTALIRAVERRRAATPPADRLPPGTPDDALRSLGPDDGSRLPHSANAQRGSAPRDSLAAGAAAPTFVSVDSVPPTFVGSYTTSPTFLGSYTTPPMFVGSDSAPPMFVTCRYTIWMSTDEYVVLQRALSAVRARDPDEAGSERPDFACLALLLDEFVHTYAATACEMRDSYPLFERDGWRCRVPTCSAHGPLHLHHIVFRAHGGGDEPDNLVTLCDFHHKALHDGWIRCAGRAPHALYWELGLDRSGGYGHAPIARFAGQRRLAEDEYWDGLRVRRMTTGRRGVA